MPALWETPRPCRVDGCDMRVILARRAQSRHWLAFEAQDRPPFTELAAGCWVLVDGVAWKPRDLIEQMQASYEVAEPRARELVAGYPFHRLHTHRDPSKQETTA